MRIDSLYICVRDMERAVNFYESFFDRKVSLKNDIYSVFDINGFRFGLFAFEKMKEDHLYGSNCLPSISFSDINELNDKLRDKDICFPLKQIGSNWVAEIIDSEGNHIEITAPC